MADIDLRVPVFDFDTGEFVIGLDGTVKTVTGSEAVGMIAVKAEETERGVFPVYGDFENEEENKKYIYDNILHNHPTLPIGEFAIGTNTTAYVAGKKYNIEDKMPILIAEKTGLPVKGYCSGPLGGDQQIGAKIVEGQIDFMIFLWDPLEAQPHDPDVRALSRIAVLYDIPTANNLATADFMLKSEFMNSTYERKVENFNKTIQDRVDNLNFQK